jgi:hypothetical protein
MGRVPRELHALSSVCDPFKCAASTKAVVSLQPRPDNVSTFMHAVYVEFLTTAARHYAKSTIAFVFVLAILVVLAHIADR